MHRILPWSLGAFVFFLPSLDPLWPRVSGVLGMYRTGSTGTQHEVWSAMRTCCDTLRDLPRELATIGNIHQ
jgi:hypothetical protein